MGSTPAGSLTLHAVATNPSPDTVLTSLDGDSRPIEEWLTTFHYACVVLDPYTNESAWILKTASRILAAFSGSDARTTFVLTCSRDEARNFLGPLTEEFMVLVDPDRGVVKQLGLKELPAFGVRRTDGTVPAAAEGWNALEWRAVADEIATTCAWKRPNMPVAGDPSPFHGTPALAS